MITRKKLQSARVEQQRLIAVQARSAYQNNGREEYLKLLLNQQNPEKFARTLTYYDYLSKARTEQLRTFNETLRQLANVEQDIGRQQEQLLTQRADLDSRRQALVGERDKRQQVLAKLNSDMKERDQKLQSREQDQADLGKVLKTIEETLARQAREAEEARQRALLAKQEEEKRRKEQALAAAARNQQAEPEEPPKRPAPRLARWFPATAPATAVHFPQPGENFHGQSMVDCWHASVTCAAAMPGPSGTA